MYATHISLLMLSVHTKGPTFDVSRIIRIRFIGEAGVDDGGPKREFFRLFYEATGQSSGMFQGWPEGIRASITL